MNEFDVLEGESVLFIPVKGPVKIFSRLLRLFFTSRHLRGFLIDGRLRF